MPPAGKMAAAGWWRLNHPVDLSVRDLLATVGDGWRFSLDTT
jgi:hypothetical protein